MGVKVYISGISGNKEVKKRQQRVLMILDSKHIPYSAIDITEPGQEQEKLFMQENSNAKDSKYPLPPQIFNEEDYCGDYDEFDLANETDVLEDFLKMKTTAVSKAEVTLQNQTEDTAFTGKKVQINGVASRETSAEKETPAPASAPVAAPVLASVVAPAEERLADMTLQETETEVSSKRDSVEKEASPVIEEEKTEEEEKQETEASEREASQDISVEAVEEEENEEKEA